MRSLRHRLPWLAIASVLVLCGCGGGGGTGGSNAAVLTALARYFDALGRGDLEGVRASLAADYRYDPGSPLSDPTNPFDRPAGIRYRSLSYRIETLTPIGNATRAIVRTTFEGDLNLELAGLGRPPVSGNARLELELEPRGGEQKLTAIRPIRVTFRHPRLPVSSLSNLTVNGLTALEVAPGAPLKLAGTSIASSAVVGVIGSTPQIRTLQVDPSDLAKPQRWELDLKAPETPARYLVYAITLVVEPDPATGQPRFLAGDEATIAVTVTR